PRYQIDLDRENRNELKYYGVYFLFEEDRSFYEGKGNSAYIGESENISERLKSHHKNKENWNTAIVFTTTGEENQLTKADIKYLENYCYQKALEADRYALNQNTPTKSFVHESREADLMDMYKTITDLLTFLGFPLFVPQMNENEMRESDNLYFITTRDADAKAIYSQDGMTVMKGSKTVTHSTKSFANEKLLKELIASKVIDNNGVFLKDY